MIESTERHASRVPIGVVAVCLMAFALVGCGPNIYDAAAFGELETVQELVQADPTLVNRPSTIGKATGKTPIFFAISANREPIVEFLLENGADLDAHDATGYAPLHVAVLMGRVDIVKRLIEAGADHDVRDNFGDTPMHVLAHSRFAGDPERRRAIIRVLEAAGSSTTVTNTEGKTPLDLAHESFRDDGIKVFETQASNK